MDQVVIVGAGPVGAVLAVYLSRLGLNVTVLERAPASGDFCGAGQSINITLCTRGLRVLDEIGVGDAVRRLSVPCYGRVIHHSDGSTRFQPYGSDGEALYSIGRGTLARRLVELARSAPGVEIRSGVVCEDADLDTGSLFTSQVASGQREELRAERIFAADGAYSAIRRAMQRRRRFDYQQTFHDQEYRELGLGAAAEGARRLAPNALHLWPRGKLMLIAFPNPDRSFTLALHLPYDGPVSCATVRDETALTCLLHAEFPDVADDLEASVGGFFSTPSEAMVTIKCRPWSYGERFALIGDAAHAFLPSYGQGANAGFEDCKVLAECLARQPQDFGRAFQAYEELRRPNTDVLADLAHEHYRVLGELVANAGWQLRARIERRLAQIFPEHQPLYYRIAFTDTPYRVAAALERAQTGLVDALASHPEIETILATEEFEPLARRLRAASVPPGTLYAA